MNLGEKTFCSRFADQTGLISSSVHAFLDTLQPSVRQAIHR